MDDAARGSLGYRRRLLTDVWERRGITFHDPRLTARTTLPEVWRPPSELPTAPGPEPTPAEGTRSAQSLPIILGDAAAEFVLGAVLGEGGMGVVFTARQNALERDVAVKMPRAGTTPPDADKPGARTPETHAHILREGRTTGALEHPNIVPIHALGRDGSGQPVIVMKRIEGESWRAALDRDPDPRGANLDRHIGVLIQVATALHYAHSRGVVHRDLKPDNVMLGAFGETYVVDWGLAVGSGDAAPRHLPSASSVKTIVGTPAYMAPEMAEGNGDRISPRTDVYLLGALLHELLVGAPPHDHANTIDALVSAFQSLPFAYPATVPAGLAAICHRAMAADPDQRFEDAGAFREALVHVRQTHGSVLLTETALASLAELRALAPREDLAAPARERVRDLAAECQFGFAQALRIWPGNEAARAGLQDALEIRIAYELARNAPDAAELLLHELPTPRPDLAAQVALAASNFHAEGERLRRVAWDNDLGIASGLRTRILVISSVLWFAAAAVLHVLTRSGILAPPHLWMAVMAFGACLLGAGVVWAHRRDLLRNGIGRRIVVTYFVAYVTYLVFWVVAAWAGVSFAGAAALMMVASAGLWAVLAVFADRLMAVLVPSSLASALLVVWQPDLVFIWYGITIPLGLNAFAVLENRRRRRVQAPG